MISFFKSSFLCFFVRFLVFLAFPSLFSLEPSPEQEGIFSFANEGKLFQDLELVHNIDQKLKDHLPFLYNYTMVVGYFNMPSARMSLKANASFGASIVKPYDIYGLNFKPLDRLELALNYRVYKGLKEANFGSEGFGDDAERIANVKLGVLTQQDGFLGLPEIAIGAEDFLGTKRFHSKYVVATKQFLDWNLECTLGWGKGRLKGFFAGAAWTPFRQKNIPFLKDLSFLIEYDAIDYKKCSHEHPSGRVVKSRINGGLSVVGWDILQLSLSSVRGTNLAGSLSLRYPIGETNGLFAKVDDTSLYQSPIDHEPLGMVRTELDFAQEIAYALGDQGLDLYTAFIVFDQMQEKGLWLKIVNNRYRQEWIVRERIQHVLASLTPSDIQFVVVVIEADALPCQSYHYRTEDLRKWQTGKISDFELETLSPIKEAPVEPSSYEVPQIFQRHKPIWAFTIRPRLLTFFGSSSGKFKYNISAIASPEGYLFNQVYYKLQLSYSIKSLMQGLGGPDRLNPSKLLIVRTDSLKYFKTNTVHMEQAFLQRGWNLGKGWFYRLALGYFEPAYGGGATELIYDPVNTNWAVGLEFATVMKRRYEGIKFSRTTWQLRHNQYVKVPFVGVQYFLDLYYDFKPLHIDFLVSAGQFLAKDKGVRFAVGKYFKSGLRFSIWYTVTNGHDRVNGHTYYDKGFAFAIPLDMFLRQSSRSYIGYAMAAWLRDVGARALTGKQLYWTLEEERYRFH